MWDDTFSTCGNKGLSPLILHYCTWVSRRPWTFCSARNRSISWSCVQKVLSSSCIFQHPNMMALLGTWRKLITFISEVLVQRNLLISCFSYSSKTVWGAHAAVASENWALLAKRKGLPDGVVSRSWLDISVLVINIWKSRFKTGCCWQSVQSTL